MDEVNRQRGAYDTMTTFLEEIREIVEEEKADG